MSHHANPTQEKKCIASCELQNSDFVDWEHGCYLEGNSNVLLQSQRSAVCKLIRIDLSMLFDDSKRMLVVVISLPIFEHI